MGVGKDCFFLGPDQQEIEFGSSVMKGQTDCHDCKENIYIVIKLKKRLIGCNSLNRQSSSKLCDIAVADKKS